MYLQRLELVNTGPIERVEIECRFDNDGFPKPIIFVGQNGSGKSVVTAHVVSALISACGTVFEDADVEEGKVYSPIHLLGTLWETNRRRNTRTEVAET
jgi:predicted ATP-binding protein involved in virulence